VGVSDVDRVEGTDVGVTTELADGVGEAELGDDDVALESD
jgi:hypothetical protein